MKNTVRGFIVGLVLGVTVIGTVAWAASGEIRNLAAEFRGITISVDHKQIATNDAAGNAVEPFIVDGTTYVPIRAIAEALDKDVVWDGEGSSVEIFTKSAPVTGADVEKAFEEKVLKVNTLVDYKIKSVKKVDWTANGVNAWLVEFDVKPAHNPDAVADFSKSPYMYGWAAGNGEVDGDWVMGKQLFVNVVKTDGVVQLDVIGTSL